MKTTQKTLRTVIKLKVWKVKAEFAHTSTEVSGDNPAHPGSTLLITPGKNDIKQR
ncbi:hypothetical protein [Mucilaginibacter kameinonensis]|uniref:hypothetical protein n=1 Tax=Mucilaginibacter kameinonensis TaxID=452286 RepID=UPI0013CEC91E|nr:hypothetical protein [Mucilaginibacter kameinonensis]